MHVRRALLVGLHREPEAVPARSAAIATDALEELERQLEPIRFLGVERERRCRGCARAPRVDQTRGDQLARTRRCAHS